MFFTKKVCLPFIILILASGKAFTMPIDWHGVYGVDTTLVDNYRRVKSTTAPTSIPAGSQEQQLANGAHSDASFQSYIFKLQPHLIVNDSATFKAEFTSGYGRGGRLGDSMKKNKTGGYANALYMQNITNPDNELVINKAYIELYSDTATYIIGRHSSHFGLGALINSGENSWDRHSFTRDGMTMKIKLGNFNFAPFWAKISSGYSLTKPTKSSEYGVQLIYDNIERDLGFGVLYSKKKTNAFNTEVTSGASGSSVALGETEVKLTDLYFKKGFGDFTLQLEVPILSGNLGYVYGSTSQSKYKAKAILFETDYKINNTLSMSIDAGKVSGDSGSKSSFNAMYLNPNYQIANLLFRYNLSAVQDTSENIYDSYITNAMYLKYSATWTLEKWTWITSLIYARAEEVAVANSSSFDHENNKIFTATTSQADDLGLELDLNFKYRWNEAVTFGGNFGYLMTGDYYSYTNDSSAVNSADNSYVIQLNTSVRF